MHGYDDGEITKIYRERTDPENSQGDGSNEVDSKGKVVLIYFGDDGEKSHVPGYQREAVRGSDGRSQCL